MSVSEMAWTCPSCKSSVASTPFCPTCGERSPANAPLTAAAVLRKAIEATTSIDSKLLRTFWRLLRRPGELTAAYARGERVPYLAPIKLFLIANAVFFAIQSLTGTNVFSSSLDSHLHHQDWSAYAQVLAARHVARAHTTLQAYAPVFDRAVVLHAKSMVVLMAMAFAALLPLFFLKARRPLMTHVVFALHLYTFLLLVFSLASLAARAEALLGGQGLDSPRVDNVLTVLILLACTAYIHVSTGPVYAAAGAARATKAALLAVLAGAIVIGYRFVLLPITLMLT